MVRLDFKVLSFRHPLGLGLRRWEFLKTQSWSDILFFSVIYDSATTTRHMERRKSHSVELKLHQNIEYPQPGHPG